MRIMPTSAVFLLYGFIGSAHAADGIQCMFLPAWSEPVQGYSVNLHHVFCGESGKKQRAKGFHSMPGGKAPSTYVKSNPGAAPNAAGVYTLKRIELVFNGKNYVKSFSSMFPDHCTQVEVVNSIVYASINNIGQCANPGWAKCGPSAPAQTEPAGYCRGKDGKPFTIAAALLGKSRINTGFPIFQPGH